MRKTYRHFLLWSGSCGLLGLGGCLAGLENAIDLVVAPDAFANATALPSSGLATLAELFIRAF